MPPTSSGPRWKSPETPGKERSTRRDTSKRHAFRISWSPFLATAGRHSAPACRCDSQKAVQTYPQRATRTRELLRTRAGWSGAYLWGPKGIGDRPHHPMNPPDALYGRVRGRAQVTPVDRPVGAVQRPLQDRPCLAVARSVNSLLNHPSVYQLLVTLFVLHHDPRRSPGSSDRPFRLLSFSRDGLCEVMATASIPASLNGWRDRLSGGQVVASRMSSPVDGRRPSVRSAK